MRGQFRAAPVATLLLLLLTALACGGQKPTAAPDTEPPPALQPATNVPVQASTRAPTENPTQTPTQTVRPVTDAPRQNPVNTPAQPQDTATTAATAPPTQGNENREHQPEWTLSPLDMDTPALFLSSVTEAERLCIETNLTPGEIQAMTGRTTVAPLAGIEDAVECMGDETLARLIIQGIVAGKEPLTPGSSTCIQDNFDPDSFRALAAMEFDSTEELTADVNIEITRSLRAALITINCLTDADWQRADRMYQTDRAVISCILEATGGLEDPQNGYNAVETFARAAQDCNAYGGENNPERTREYGTRPDQDGR